MGKYSKNIYKLLRTIDYCYSRKIKIEFDLEKLELNKHELGLYLHNLVEAGYVGGIIISRALGETHYERYKAYEYAYITLTGLMFLEENSEMKNLYKTLIEIRDWFCAIVPIGFQFK